MRFAALAAFTLPLTAFAAPRPTSRQLDSADEFAGAIDRFRLAYLDTIPAIGVMIDQLSESQNPQELVISEGVQVASRVSQIAILATGSIFDSVNSNGSILEIDQYDIIAATTSGQIILKRLHETVNEEDFSKKVDNNLDLNNLRSNISNALDGFNRMVEATIDILGIRKKSVRQLFEKAEVLVPPSF